jgi:hypothetical protein
MRFHKGRVRLGFDIMGMFFTTVACTGCSRLGPASISKGRAAYNEAITRTDDEQMLMSIVRSRYGETYDMLAVTAIAANIRFRATAGVEAGFGPSSSYDGNLVPFSGGVAYEENPTITYAPANSVHYVRELLMPIPLDILIMTVRATAFPGHVFTVLVQRVNDIRNPDFLAPSAKPDPRFARFIELIEEMGGEGLTYWAKDPDERFEFDMVITNYAPAYSEKVRELLTMLGLPLPEDESEDVIVPVGFALRADEVDAIGITTRSTLDLIEILRATVQVPEEHAREGLAISYPRVGLPGEGVRISSSAKRPKNAWLAVEYRDYWFSIEESDQVTKALFRTTSTLWKASIAGGAGNQTAPVLTVPVSR